MAKQASRHEIRYVYRGDVERGTGRGYRWHEGYSEDLPGGVSYPWLTKREAQADAKTRGGHAVFVDRRGEALRAMLVEPPEKKSSAQIKREVDEILAGGHGGTSGTPEHPLRSSEEDMLIAMLQGRLEEGEVFRNFFASVGKKRQRWLRALDTRSFHQLDELRRRAVAYGTAAGKELSSSIVDLLAMRQSQGRGRH